MLTVLDLASAAVTASQDDPEGAISPSPNGLVNPFITYSVAFVEGRVRSYRIDYLDADGSVGRFDKHFQNTKAPHPAERASKRWIVWEGGAPPLMYFVQAFFWLVQDELDRRRSRLLDRRSTLGAARAQ